MGLEKENDTEAREQAARVRDEAADARDRAAGDRDVAAYQRDAKAQALDEDARRNRRSEADRLADRGLRDEAAAAVKDRRRAAADRESTDMFLDRLREYEAAITADRRAAAEDRLEAAQDRREAARDRELAAWEREQAAVEAAQMTSEDLTRSTGQAPFLGAGPPLSGAPEADAAQRVWPGSREAGLESVRHAADLANQIAETEERIAATLRELAAHADPGARGRRLALAEAAVVGMRAAGEHRDRLRALAVKATDDLLVGTLRTLLSHAATTFESAAQTEGSIADALESLAGHENPEAAAVHRREAEDARASAAVAVKRATELRRLALAANPHRGDGGSEATEGSVTE